MLFSNFIWFLSLLAITSVQPAGDRSGKPPIKWQVQVSSTLGIEGQSNINKFRCDIEKYDQPDTIICFDNATLKQVALKGSLKIDLLSFNCHSRLITNDMRKTLKTDEYPNLVIRFISLERAPVFNGTPDMIKGWVNIELAGVKKSFEILYSFTQPDAAVIILNGGRSFNFSDFNLKPPRKLAGIIKIRDEFSVNFRLMLIPF